MMSTLVEAFFTIFVVLGHRAIVIDDNGGQAFDHAAYDMQLKISTDWWGLQSFKGTGSLS
tara:strand:+ start:492 stop:671 length:180 start_codon:yes stop_codon:yes gene_type:complete